MAPPQYQITIHRGYVGEEPVCTIAAFAEAIEIS